VPDNLFEQTKLHHELQLKERDLAQKEWFFGITGIMAFLIGLGCLAYVAVSLAAS
jgi:uncharacterized membrane protein HdeD (DUF308 family)